MLRHTSLRLIIALTRLSAAVPLSVDAMARMEQWGTQLAPFKTLMAVDDTRE